MKRKPSTDAADVAAIPATPGTNGSNRQRAVRRGPGPAPGSREANKLAIAILDVLAGARLPAEAAQAVGVSLPRYYQLEQRVLNAIVKACEPRAKGPPTNPERVRLKLERQIARLTQECSRQQALVRAAQRTIGLAPPSPARPAGAKDGASRKKRQRKPTVRALAASRRLREAAAAQEAAAVDAVSATPSPDQPTSLIPEGGSPS